MWHFTSSNSIKMIEKVQERLLRFLYNDFYSSYEDLLRLAGKTTMLISRLKTLCIEIYRTINFENPNYMNNIFTKSNYRSSLRFNNNIEVPQVTQVTYGSRSLRALGPKIWNGLNEEIKSSKTLEIFKKNIKNWGGWGGQIVNAICVVLFQVMVDFFFFTRSGLANLARLYFFHFFILYFIVNILIYMF